MGEPLADAANTAEPVSAFYISSVAGSPRERPHVLKQGECFAAFDAFGNIGATTPGSEGVFFEDTRYVSRLALRIDGVRPLLLSSHVREDDTALIVDLANPDLMQSGRLRLAKNTVHILNRTMLGEDALFFFLELHNFGVGPAAFRLELDFDADFADIFELRGTPRKQRGRLLPDERGPGSVAIAYRGLDRQIRRARFLFEPAAEFAAPRRVYWNIELPSGAHRDIRLSVRCEQEGRAFSGTSWDVSEAAIRRRIAERKARSADLRTSDDAFNLVLDRARADLDMLTTKTPQGLYPYAGIPWFSTAFGRDGVITALLSLWLDPALAAGTLRFLAANQATEWDDANDAAPGKILHETRKSEMAILGEVPFRKYYGAVDTTPLFVVLAAAYYGRTGDLELVRSIWPNVEAALGWMAGPGDIDGDGFLEYDSKSPNGLTNQGWKDSGDAIFHRDGRLAQPPIALAEVQSYAFAALHGGATLATALGDVARARELLERASRLQARFEAAFWLEDLETYAIALDRDKEPCRVRSSNAGQVLLGGLVDPARAARVAKMLMAPSSFSSWGIRTIAETEARYNPISYHNGSVWPHDNALIAIGFGRYGIKPPILRLLTGLFDAARFMERRRLPELLCGFARRPGSAPTLYPVACLPQAWSSASILGVLGAALGISFDAPARRVCFTRPVLPPWLGRIELSNLRLADASVDLMLLRGEHGVALHVIRREGPIEVSLVA